MEELILLKENKLLKPYAKFLVLLCKYRDANSIVNILKEVVGGSYVLYAKEGVVDGLVEYERGKAPRLTERGEALCGALLECWAKLKEKEKEIRG